MAPTNAESLLKAIDATVDPVKACDRLYECIQQLTSQLIGVLGQDNGMPPIYAYSCTCYGLKLSVACIIRGGGFL